MFTLFFTQGVAACQYDAWDVGFLSNDNFGDADLLYHESMVAIREALCSADAEPMRVPVVTGFLAKGRNTGGIQPIH